MKSKFNALYLLILVVSGVIAVSCDKTEVEERPVFTLATPSDIDSINYEVYSTLVNNRVGITVVEQKVTGSDVVKYYKEDFMQLYPDFDTTMVKNSLLLENTTVYLGPYFKTTNTVVKLLPDEELSYYFDNPENIDGWDKFYEDYEGADGILSFSRIAFNDAKTQAVFATGFGYGWSGGDGSLILMVKENGKWKVKASISTWIA